MTLEKTISRLARAVAELRGQGLPENINQKLDRIIMTQAELSVALDKLTAQVGKVAAEQSNRFDTLSAEIKRLTDIINAGEVTPEVGKALETVQAALESLDQSIPDAPTT
jgi:ABC-type transporter Mla subunit MlaD